MSELKTIYAEDTFDEDYMEYHHSDKRYYREVYLKAEADKVIAELEKKNKELNAENERLKRCEIWMKQHFYCEEVIACESAKNRRLKRALWIARAERAKDRAMMCNDFAYLSDTERDINMALARTWMKCRLLKSSEWSKVWQNVERKCRAKAEEYK